MQIRNNFDGVCMSFLNLIHENFLDFLVIFVDNQAQPMVMVPWYIGYVI